MDFGLCIFYLLAQIEANPAIIVLIMMITVTGIEYIAGLIFIKGMGVKLWDYSQNWGNIDGLICPLYMVLWGILGAIYYFLINPYIEGSISWLQDNLAFSFFVGVFFGIIAIDIAYSTQLVVKIRRFAREKGLIVKYEEFKASILEQAIASKEKYSFVFAINNNVKAIEEHLNEYVKEQIKRTNKIKRTLHLFIRDKVKIKKGNKDEGSSSKSKKGKSNSRKQGNREDK